MYQVPRGARSQQVAFFEEAEHQSKRKVPAPLARNEKWLLSLLPPTSLASGSSIPNHLFPHLKVTVDPIQMQVNYSQTNHLHITASSRK